MKRKTTLECYNFTLTKRPKIVSKILDLPTDVMILIFKLLTPLERRNAMTVCQQWLDVVNEYFSKDHCLVLTSDMDYSTTGSLYRTFSDRLSTTKGKRTFSHFEIKSFPENAGKLSLMGNFIELIGNEVKSLKIEKISYYPDTVVGDRFKLKLFSKLPRLETLEVSSDLLLADLSSATSLKSIKVLSSSCDMNLLKNCRKVKSLESLTMSGIELTGSEISDESIVSFLEPSTKALIEPYKAITLEAPTFNFCGKAKMTPDDISGIRMKSFDKPLSQEILCQFGNLKRLKFYPITSIGSPPSSPLIQLKERVAFSGIKALTVKGYEQHPSPHFDKLFQSFPGLESLKVCGIGLKNEHFLLICQNCPKLKKLVLRGLWLEISVLDKRSSLKNLRFLEKLEIEHIDRSMRINGRAYPYVPYSGQWPALPNLKELSLQGNGFSDFNRVFYSQIAKNSPKLTHITIEDIYDQFTFDEFLPLVSQLKLTHLSLPSVSDDFLMELTANLIKYCQELKEVTITSGVGLSLSQEVELFSKIVSLTKITSVTWIMDNEENRVMQRNDVKNLKRYLLKNLWLYKNLRETVDYVAENVIPPNEFQEMNQSFQTNHANDDEAEDLANFYIVTQNFLQMSNFNLCKLLYKILDASDF